MSLPAGLFKLGKIDSVSSATNNAVVSIDSSGNLVGATAVAGKVTHDVQILHPINSNNGIFVGALPPKDSPVVLLQGPNNKHEISSYLPSNPFNTPPLKQGELLLQTGTNNKILLNQSDDIFIGLGVKDSPGSIHIKPNNNLLNLNFYRQVSFSQGSRRIEGTVKRDKNPNPIWSGDQKLYSDDYDTNLVPVGLDPTMPVSNVSQNQNKNPAFIESRNIIYEFSYNSDVRDPYLESTLYQTSSPKSFPSEKDNRRKSRADTLSLSLTNPNYLIESVQGTVIDIYGNILDINRYPLPIGSKDLTLKTDNNSGSIDKSKIYLDIRAEQRKSIAYHFELNARKALDATISPPDINNFTKASENYGRDRGRFYIDIDKEGQFKINVPASSETGNIPLLTRYENYSTLNPDTVNQDKKDILQESFAAGMVKQNPKYPDLATQLEKYNKGVITIKKNNAETTPLDRFFSDVKSKEDQVKHIKHGTAYHDITATCLAHQITLFSDYLFESIDQFYTYFPRQSIDFKLVSTEIEVSGENAKAGGRSGLINLDGSIELNIGANTQDRQSIWLDTAGGMIANFGRDNNYVSAAINMDGYLLLQVGGYGVLGDSRFKDKNNGFIPGVVDIRVATFENRAVVIRIDESGINIISPKQVTVQSNGDMMFKATGNILMEGERVVIQGREFFKAGTVAQYA